MSGQEYDDTPSGRSINWRDLEMLESSFDHARRMVDEDARLERDMGSAVLGAGIALDVVEKGCRKPKRRIIVGAAFQGNVGSYRAAKRALTFLRHDVFKGQPGDPNRGIPAYWYDGIMD